MVCIFFIFGQFPGLEPSWLTPIFSGLVGSAFAWEQPSYASIIAGWNQKTAGNWGHPVIGNARHWSDCPAIDTTTIAGIDGLRCNQATCALACKPGYVATGRRRAKCRKNKKTGKWFWKNTLGSCQTCSVETPMSNDPAMTTTCKVNASKYSHYLYLQKSVCEPHKTRSNEKW